jgi:uncharacterized membrane protein
MQHGGLAPESLSGSRTAHGVRVSVLRSFMHGPRLAVYRTVMTTTERSGVPVWVPLRARTRLLVALPVAIGAALVHGPVAPFLRVVVGWSAGAIVLLLFAWGIILCADATETAVRAAAEDPGRRLVHVMVVIASALSLVGAVGVLSAGPAAVWTRILCFGSVVPSWLLIHTYWALHYAHLYYRDDEAGAGEGLVFPGNTTPDDFDFAYFAFTIGMTFQVSDVTITSRPIRCMVLVHGLESFVVNTAVIALALNLAMGQLQ